MLQLAVILEFLTAGTVQQCFDIRRIELNLTPMSRIEAGPLVQGIENACHQSFKSYTAAVEAYKTAKAKGYTRISQNADDTVEKWGTIRDATMEFRD